MAVPPVALVLADAERRLLARLQELGARLDRGDDVWADFIQTVATLRTLVPPEREERFNISPRTARRLGRTGKLGLEAVRLGPKRGSAAIRWRG